MLVVRILIALYGDDVAESFFAVCKENRKYMRLNPLRDSDLYGNKDYQRPPPYPNIPTISPEPISALSPDQMRSILSLVFSFGTQNANPATPPGRVVPPNPIVPPNPGPLPNPVYVQYLDGSDSANEQVTDPFRVRNEPKFRLELAVGRLQSYYSKANKFGGDFEDDLEDALA